MRTSRLPVRLLVFGLGLASCVASPCRTAEPAAAPGAESLAGICDGMLRTLLARVELPAGQRLRVTVGKIPCNNVGTEGISTFSRLVQDAFEGAVGRAPKAQLITRSRLDELIQEGNFQTLDILDPSTALKGLSIKGLEAIIRGHYYYNFPVATVKVEMVWLSGAETTVVSANVPVSLVGTGQVLPPAEAKQIEQKLLPPSVSQTEANAASVLELLKALPNREIKAEIWVKGGHTDFAEGEKVAFTVRVDRACHIAVFDHQIDGSTVLLFPNRYSSATRVAAGELVAIPGEDRDRFHIEVAPPFGGEIVQVIACTSKSRLEGLIRKRQPLGKDYAIVSRGLLTRGLQVVGSGPAAEAEDEATAPGPAQWGEAHVVVNSYPR